MYFAKYENLLKNSECPKRTGNLFPIPHAEMNGNQLPNQLRDPKARANRNCRPCLRHLPTAEGLLSMQPPQGRPSLSRSINIA